VTPYRPLYTPARRVPEPTVQDYRLMSEELWAVRREAERAERELEQMRRRVVAFHAGILVTGTVLGVLIQMIWRML
jgi:hypothetical protein